MERVRCSPDSSDRGRKSTARALTLRPAAFILGGELAVSGQSLLAVSGQILVAANSRAERGGLIRRQLDHDRIETATLYQLTELGRSLELPLSAFGQWAGLNWPTVDMAQRQWDSGSDGSSPSP
jgi:hypothetical protein